MLVLSRKKDQTIVIGDRITIKVVSIRGSRVSIGIEAPPDVQVHRGELVPAEIRDPRNRHRLPR